MEVQTEVYSSTNLIEVRDWVNDWLKAHETANIMEVKYEQTPITYSYRDSNDRLAIDTQINYMAYISYWYEA